MKYYCWQHSISKQNPECSRCQKLNKEKAVKLQKALLAVKRYNEEIYPKAKELIEDTGYADTVKKVWEGGTIKQLSPVNPPYSKEEVKTINEEVNELVKRIERG